MHTIHKLLKILLPGILIVSTAYAEIAVEQPAGNGLTNGLSSSSFGSATIGSNGSSLVFTVRNPGTSALDGLAVTVAGSAESDFTFQNGALPSSLAPGGSAMFSVTFRPWHSGSRTATLRISSNDPVQNPFVVTLNGTGLTQAGPEQSIMVAALPSVVRTTADPFPILAGATSGLPLTYSVLTGPATISPGGVVALTETPGPVTVRLSQAGGSGYAPSEPHVTFQTAERQEFATLAKGSSASHSAGIRADGTLWAWGYNIYGQVGDGTTVDRGSPTQVGTAADWIAVACGLDFTMGVRSDGSLWAWGDNNSGQLGDDTTTHRSSPVQIGSATGWQSVACGATHSVAVKSDGTLWAWGLNSSGQLGTGTGFGSRVPYQVGTATNWATVACGENYSMALKSDGTLWAWGKNTYGQLGDASSTMRYTPVQVGTNTNWASVACGEGHTMALMTDGTLWGWGNNMSGELGDGTSSSRNNPARVGTDSNWTDVACNNAAFTVAVKRDGSLWAWGSNFRGQLGDGTTIGRNIPVPVGSSSGWTKVTCGAGFSLAVQSDGSLWALGNNTYGQLGGFANGRARPAPIGADGKCANMACGGEHAVAVKGDGTLWAWGANNSGQLGDGTTVPRTAAGHIGTATDWSTAACGLHHTVAIKRNGTLWSWGRNSDGQLGTGNATWYNSPIQVGTAANWVYVACGAYHTLAIKADGTLWAWGNGSSGQLGDGSTGKRNTPFRIGTATNWVSAAAGTSHSMAIRSDGSLWAWGYNFYGRLGDGTSNQYSTPVRIAAFADWAKVACGDSHTMALTSNGTLYAWGNNMFGQLGDSTTGTWFSPVQIGMEGGWTSVACGKSHTMAVATDGTLWAWGSNSLGQLGDGTSTNRKSPNRVGSGNGWKSLPATLGEQFSGMLGMDGSVWTCGAAYTGQLAIPGANVAQRVWPARASQSVAFAPLAPVTIGQPVTLSTTTSSHLPETRGVDGPATLNGDTLTRTAAGDIRIFAWQAGDDTWDNTQPQAIGAPAVVTLAASTVTPTSAVLNGTVSPDGLATDAWFEYGPANTYGSTVIVSPSPGDGNSAQAVMATLAGLTPGSPYHYRLAATNSLGTVYGADQLVTTGPVIAVKQQPGIGLINGSSVSDFGNTAIGTMGNTLTFTVTNIGSMPLNGLAALLDDGGRGDYLLDATKLPASLAPGSSRIFTVTFRPLLGGPRVALLRLSSNDPSNNPFEIALNGSGLTQPGPQQSISATPPVVVDTGTQPFLLPAAATSDLPLTYSVVTGPATINSDGLVTLTGGTGGVTIRLQQSGGNGYDPTETYVTFQVTDGMDFVTLGDGTMASHSAGIRSNGTLWLWGKNDGGQLGNGTKTDSSTPIQVDSSSNWSSVACGWTYTVAIKTDGTLWAWGSNGGGQLGDGTFTERVRPVQIGTGNDWVRAACGQYHTMALKSNGTLWAWGANGYGQLGDGSLTTSNIPLLIGTASDWISVDCGMSHTVAMRSNGTIWTWGDNSSGQIGDGTSNSTSSPQQVGSASDWVAVKCGSYSNLAIKGDGTLWGWGSNFSGQLGDGTTVNRSRPVRIGVDANWVAVASGSSHTMAVKSDGTLWSWGDNGSKQLGDGTNLSRLSPVQVGTAGHWSSVVCGGSHTLAIRDDHTLWAWGNNSSGQLGYSRNTGIYAPVSVGDAGYCVSAASGYSHTVVVTSDGELWGWGLNSQAQIAQNDVTTPYTIPTRIGLLSNWLSVSCGSNHTVALNNNGLLWAWGSGAYGQLGNGANSGSSSPTLVGSASNWSAASCGAFHTLALKNDGSLWSWGYNPYGGLGDGTSTNRNIPVQVGAAKNWKMAVGGQYHTAGVRTDGTLWTWGYNNNGQLGDGTTSNRSIPIQIGTDTNWQSVACGSFHTIAIKNDGSLWAWGNNSNGQLGDGTSTQRTLPVRIGIANSWASVGCGTSCTMAVKSDGTLWAWGKNSAAQLGDNTTTQHTSPVQIGTANGWGRPLVSLGDQFGAVLTASGKLWTCGNDSNGQLGLVDLKVPKQIWPERLPQELNFPALPPLGIGHPVQVAAAAGSGLPLSPGVFGPASLNGNWLTATNPGTVKVTAWQPGDSTWRHSDPMCQIQTSSGAAPVIAASSSMHESATTLTFTGMVNPGGLATTAYFEYGITESYGSTVAVALSPDNGVDVQDVNAIATGLTPGMTYYFRLVATNDAGTIHGVSQQATTLAADDPLPPAVTLTLSGNPLVESGGVATVTATLSSARANAVTVNLAFSGAAQLSADYTVSGNSIMLPPGAISGSVVLNALQDELYENPDETIEVNVVSVVNGTENGVQRVTATIRDDDLKPFPLVAGQRGTVTCLANPSIGYDVYLPPDYAIPDKPLPIIYTFNPSGGGLVSEFQSVCANLQIIVVGCKGFRNGVEWDDILREVDAVTKDIRQRVRFDPTAEIASGFSGGGVACYGFSRFRPQHVTGIYPLAGWMGRDGIYYQEDRVPTGLEVARSTGTSDFAAQYYRAADKNYLTSCGALVADWDFIGGHQVAPDEQKSSALMWILNHRMMPQPNDRNDALAQANLWHSRIASGDLETVLHEVVETIVNRPRSWFSYQAQLTLDQLSVIPAIGTLDVRDLAQGDQIWDQLYYAARGAALNGELATYHAYMKLLTGVSGVSYDRSANLREMLGQFGFTVPTLKITAVGNQLGFSFDKLTPGLSYVLETNSNLDSGTWQEIGCPVVETATGWSASIGMPTAAPMGFFRVRASFGTTP